MSSRPHVGPTTLCVLVLGLLSACGEQEHGRIVSIGRSGATAEASTSAAIGIRSSPSASTAQRTLAWEDLIPETASFEDPFVALESEQLRMLGLIVRVRTLEREKPRSVSDGMRDEVAGYEKQLTRQGIDIEGLLARREEIRQKRTSRATAVVPELGGVTVRMPGYLLPLEYEAEKVIEFLLVPWVGACIHTPPPPPNQIVHVQLSKAIGYPGYFRPVWVVGAFSTESTAEELFHVDGRAVVPTAYSMRRASVSAYEE